MATKRGKIIAGDENDETTIKRFLPKGCAKTDALGSKIHKDGKLLNIANQCWNESFWNKASTVTMPRMQHLYHDSAMHNHKWHSSSFIFQPSTQLS
jgi:hypothetical protein